MKTQAALLLSTLALSAPAFAQAQPQPKGPEPEYTLAFNAGVVTDYRYRGISQTRLLPAAQAGADFSHKSGLYLGAWGSNIRWIKDQSGSGESVKGPIELDLYGGFKFTVAGIGGDVGVLRYQYQGNTLGNRTGYVDANSTEVYAAATYSVVTFKYSRSVTNLFGNVNSTGSQYFDITATFDLGDGFTLAPHVGRQLIENGSIYNYTDYSATLTKDFGKGLAASVTAVNTNALASSYTWAGKKVGGAGAVVGVKYTF